MARACDCCCSCKAAWPSADHNDINFDRDDRLGDFVVEYGLGHGGQFAQARKRADYPVGNFVQHRRAGHQRMMIHPTPINFVDGA